MTSYNKIPLDLTVKQYENLSKGISSLTPLTIRLTQQQIRKGGGDLMLTGRQETHLDKSIARGKGANITLSATQLKKMRTEHKRGGYLVDMNKCIAGAGMYGVDAPPEMPREAGIGPEPQDGAGVKEVVQTVGSVAKRGLKTVAKVAKPIAKVALTEGCKVGSKALAVRAGIDPENPIVKVASNEGCREAVNALLGSGSKKRTLKRTTSKRPNLEKY
jgi:hypothetical protein